ncbi:T9SS type B sorting domain-containing protein [Neotamlana laminarinivorans]|uniref:T9SS type B sorting domain-containing protein n=1 Tax=Neotamlana laminarinivorans TaxID=2883124 RepID=A0A9X1L3Y6_9FLAO|nr:T9SS type B sorting domain-containing protein [Tamlana laminarinivorans]MCB4798959.1 T9SS type B sorting domain-containing protein [Tamlana laminarinivorans]
MKILYTTLFILSIQFIFSQNEAANWYFGQNAGINFNTTTGDVTALGDGSINTLEGCTSISDENGNLLFYTDGSIVYNSTHTVMDNGYSLLGDSSSTQSAIIVPKPQDPNIYYIFTVDDQITQSSPVNLGLNYSIVDMSLDGGLGSVTSKNINLVDECSEKVTAVLKDCVDDTYWVVTFAAQSGVGTPYDTFYAFEINASGVNTKAVTSTFSDLNINEGRGYLKLSPDGTKMACASVDYGLYLYDFDTLTGKVSNQNLIRSSGGDYQPYGVEFSPNSQLLYTTYSNDYFGSDSENPNTHNGILVQYNLNEANIISSEVTLDNRQLYRGGLQLGPNGKIYRALSATYLTGLPFLGVIENPNTIGTGAYYNHNAISLSSGLSTQGLPPFVSSFFNTEIDIIKNGESTNSLVLCEGTSYTLTAEDIPGADYVWTFDGTTLPESDFDLEVSQQGRYEVYIEPNNGDCALEGFAFVTLNENPTVNNITLLQCDEDGLSDGLTLFNLTEAENELANFETDRSLLFYSDSSRTVKIEPDAYYNTSNPQIVYAEVINNNTGCYSVAELTLSVSITQANHVSLPATCDDDGIEDGLHIFDLSEADNLILNGHPQDLNIRYFETYNDALLETNELNTSYTNTTPYSQIIYARTENDNNCYGINEVELTVNKLPQLTTEEITSYCLNFYPEPITINAGILEGNTTDYTYSWSTGESTFDIQINEVGDYVVTVTNANGCSKARTVSVEASNIAEISSIEVVDASANNTITVITSGEGEYQYALFNSDNQEVVPYQNSSTFTQVSPGIYTVYVQDIENDCGEVSQDVSVIGFPKYFTPNNDGINDTWQIYGVSDMFQPNTKILIFNRYGKLLKELNPTGSGWNGTYKGEVLPADDYWFAITLQDGRVYKNHFTLKQ